MTPWKLGGMWYYIAPIQMNECKTTKYIVILSPPEQELLSAKVDLLHLQCGGQHRIEGKMLSLGIFVFL